VPTIHAPVIRPTFQAEITQPRLTIELPGRHMTVEITDDGHVRVRQDSYDLLDGAPSSPDTPRYTPPGEYSFDLPEAVEVNNICDTGGITPDMPGFPSEGTFTIAATHWHG
jgi:hypothetical protein